MPYHVGTCQQARVVLLSGNKIPPVRRTHHSARVRTAGALQGDAVVAAAFMSYAGPFPNEYRTELVDRTWLPMISELRIPASAGFSFSDFLADPSDVRDWNILGLPADAFSTENGVMTTRGRRWPLMIDPQGQAKTWVKNMEGPRGLKVLDLQMPDLARQVENAIQFGNPVLLQVRCLPTASPLPVLEPVALLCLVLFHLLLHVPAAWHLSPAAT